MKLKILFILLIGLLLADASPSIAQESDARARMITAAKEIISTVPTCALITIDVDGLPRVRAMETIAPEPDMTLWFVTNPHSRKVQQIKTNPLVNIYYLEKDNGGYVTIQGKAFLINDQKEKQLRWKEQWTQHYPNGPKDCLLIKVVPQWMEVVSGSHGIEGDPKTWQAQRVEF